MVCKHGKVSNHLYSWHSIPQIQELMVSWGSNNNKKFKKKKRVHIVIELSFRCYVYKVKSRRRDSQQRFWEAVIRETVSSSICWNQPSEEENKHTQRHDSKIAWCMQGTKPFTDAGASNVNSGLTQTMAGMVCRSPPISS